MGCTVEELTQVIQKTDVFGWFKVNSQVQNSEHSVNSVNSFVFEGFT